MSDKHAQMREMARDLIRDSVIEDAIAQRIAQIVEFIHEDRIKPLEAKLAKAVERLTAMRDDRVGYRHVSHYRRGATVTLAEIEGDKT